jgi:hypothetical protein
MPIPLRADFDAQMVRAAARRSKDGPQARRLLALAAICEGASRTEAAKIGGVTLQIVCVSTRKNIENKIESQVTCGAGNSRESR